jgi:hypothetical protein
MSTGKIQELGNNPTKPVEARRLIYELSKGLDKADHNICTLNSNDDSLRGSNPVGGEILRTRPTPPWGPPSLLRVYYGNRVFIPGVNRPGH